MKNIRKLLSVSVTMLVCVAMLPASRLQAQSVSHPVAEITTTAKHFAYTHMISPTQKKDIKYIIVRASDGGIKTVFNACDVCYLADKGYSQSGTDLRCNNCGNRFAIDTLGGSNTAGTCHPGYLPHRIENDMVVIDVADLLVGEYYFKAQTVTGITALPVSAGNISLRQDRTTLTVTLPGEARRDFRVYALGGQLRLSRTDDSRTVRLQLAGLNPGAYILAVEQSGVVAAKTFIVY